MIDLSTSLFDTEQLFVDDYITVAQNIFFTSYFIAIIVIGSLGNGAIVFTVWRTEKLHSAAYALISNLAVADFLVCGVLLPLHVSKFATGIIPGRQNLWCQVETFLVTITEGSSLLSVSAVAFNRYATICNHNWKKRLTMRFIAGVITAIWFYCFSVGLTSIILDKLNIERLGLQVTLICFSTERFTYILYVLLMFAPFTVTLVSYLKIYLFLRQRKKRIQPALAINVVHRQNRKQKQKRNDDLLVLHSIVAVTCLYSVCVFFHIAFRFLLPLFVDKVYYSGIFVGSWCILLTSNWTSFFIYLIWNPSFRQALLIALKLSKKRTEITERSNSLHVTEYQTQSVGYTQGQPQPTWSGAAS